MAFWLILGLALAVIIGNLMLVKHTAHMKMPSQKQRHSDKQSSNGYDDDDEDDW
ncbi:DUF2897 domain-containing protein [Pseudidiomarina sediminum]|uniref:DUF2897 domain-containing protein n=1 Tax=Pseudidiomarina sediminum TaxID=431675 RepID=A0A432Z453_9GAMM|nr:DUF2897 family protein [Pseudidiomarina sediminum]RUO72664.1 DUF2897 domain-containing protein [Pseudidiomarina sediminum]